MDKYPRPHVGFIRLQISFGIQMIKNGKQAMPMILYKLAADLVLGIEPFS